MIGSVRRACYALGNSPALFMEPFLHGLDERTRQSLVTGIESLANMYRTVQGGDPRAQAAVTRLEKVYIPIVQNGQIPTDQELDQLMIGAGIENREDLKIRLFDVLLDAEDELLNLSGMSQEAIHVANLFG